MGRVIVGVDGSDGAVRALEFALEEARLRSARLQVVYVQPPTDAPAPLSTAEYVDPGSFRTMAAHEADQREVMQQRARTRGEKVLRDVLAKVDVGDVPVEQTLLFDHRPARELVDLAKGDDVDLLVVGSRGRGELTGLLLGSVSQACVTHARTPVTVVPS